MWGSGREYLLSVCQDRRRVREREKKKRRREEESWRSGREKDRKVWKEKNLPREKPVGRERTYSKILKKNLSIMMAV